MLFDVSECSLMGKPPFGKDTPAKGILADFLSTFQSFEGDPGHPPSLDAILTRHLPTGQTRLKAKGCSTFMRMAIVMKVKNNFMRNLIKTDFNVHNADAPYVKEAMPLDLQTLVRNPSYPRVRPAGEAAFFLAFQLLSCFQTLGCRLTFAPTLKMFETAHWEEVIDQYPSIFFVLNTPFEAYDLIFAALNALMRGRYQQQLHKGLLSYQIWTMTLRCVDEVFEV
jgi:hypothetical protein